MTDVTGTADVVDVGSLHAQHRELYINIGRAIEGAIVEMLSDAKEHAQNTTEVKNRSGRMKAGWKWIWVRTPRGVKGSLYNMVHHAFWQEVGTGVHGSVGAGYFITARPGGCLAFKGKDGAMVFRKWVFHRGVTAKYIGKRAIFGQNQTSSGGLRPDAIMERWLRRASAWK